MSHRALLDASTLPRLAVGWAMQRLLHCERVAEAVESMRAEGRLTDHQADAWAGIAVADRELANLQAIRTLVAAGPGEGPSRVTWLTPDAAPIAVRVGRTVFVPVRNDTGDLMRDTDEVTADLSLRLPFRLARVRASDEDARAVLPAVAVMDLTQPRGEPTKGGPDA